ncbi:DUF4142 domain-containing protein [Sphingobium cloacae]|uniref:Membrane protein n=1 Tax=Sphingobium cloacae TaxID=120107 RepID=A0A1E1F6L5_9SPHN|nr:DUF4142 domain-containing protein [Sphingobium cloacae]BAV66159.1 membrane protein [Sphingobium cloacae]
MKTQTSIFAIALAALALGGCGKKSEPVPNETVAAPTNGLNAVESAPVPENADQAFANAAAASDMFEVESSRLAEINSQSASVKKFAEAMIKAHTDSTAELTEAAGKATPAIVPKLLLTPEQQQALDSLKDKKGADFDAAYIAAQRKGHEETLDKLKAYAENGEVPALKAFAAKLVPVVTEHLNMAKALKS